MAGQDSSDRIVYKTTNVSLHHDAHGWGAAAEISPATLKVSPAWLVSHFAII